MTSTRGRYRAARPPRWTWLAATVGALLVFAALALAGTAAADTYNYARWPSGTICVVDKTSGNARTAVYNTVQRTKSYTWVGVRFTRQPGSNPSCSGYKNRIVVKQAYSSSSNRAWLSWSGGFYGFEDGAWQIKSPVTITLNSRYRSAVSTWEWVVAHEFAHSLGLDHRGSCSTVMRSGYSSYSSLCPAPRFWTLEDRRLIARWY